MEQPRVCVIGAGALGSTLLQRLHQHGYPGVSIVDPDRVEERNLLLSPFLRRSLAEDSNPKPSRGRQRTLLKAELLATAGAELSWRALPCEVADVGWLELQQADLICCCTDSALSRIETAFAARMLRKPLLDGGVFGDGIAEGRVSVFPAAADAACYLCGLSEDRRAAVLGYAASASLGCRAPEDTPTMTGTLATLDTIAERLFQVIESGTWRSAQGASARRLRLTDAATDAPPQGQGSNLALTRSVTCPWHDDPPQKLEPLPWEEPLADTLPPDKELQLPWPVCVEAICRTCGQRSEPMMRVARVRRRLPCAHCGQGTQEPLRLIHRVRRSDPAARLSPRQLGQPERHLYWLPKLASLHPSADEDAS